MSDNIMSPITFKPDCNYFNNRINRRQYMFEREKMLEKMNEINDYFIKLLFDDSQDDFKLIYNFCNKYWVDYCWWVNKYGKMKFAYANEKFFNHLYNSNER